jgi:nucleoside-diphosphate-sugar epimerase
LLHLGRRVIAVDRSADTSQWAGLESERLIVRHIDLDSDVAFSSLIEGVDVLYHLAEPSVVPESVKAPRENLRATTGRMIQLLEALRSSERPPTLVYTSSAAVYGQGLGEKLCEVDRLVPVSPYGAAKAASELYAGVYAQLYELDVRIARPFSLFGPGQRKLVVHDVFKRILLGESPLIIHAPPEVERDFVFVADAVSSLLSIAAHERAREVQVFNVGSGIARRLDDVIHEMVAVAGSPVEVRFTGTLREGDPIRFQADVTRLESLGYRPSTDFREGLRLTAEWLRSDLVARDCSV